MMEMKNFIMFVVFMFVYLFGVFIGAIGFNELRGFECTRADTHEGKERCVVYERTKNEN
jgi:hypothetical protein